jgi:hypothetical protein
MDIYIILHTTCISYIYIYTHTHTRTHTHIHTYDIIYLVIQVPFGLIARICAEIEVYIGIRDKRYVSSVHRHSVPYTLSLSKK